MIAYRDSSFATVACVWLMFCVSAACACACEPFQPYNDSTKQKMIDALQQSDGKLLDQMQAFQTLACSDEPALRSFAIGIGLAAKNPIVRSLALAEQIFQRDQIRIELQPDSKTSDSAKRWAASYGNALVYKIEGVIRPSNCVTLNRSSKCNDTSNRERMTIDRETVRLLYGSISGIFALQSDANLTGLLKPDSNIGDIPARIRLN